MATLQPPSFFQTTTVTPLQGEDKEATPQTVPPPQTLQDELTRLKQENESLREQVGGLQRKPPIASKLQPSPQRDFLHPSSSPQIPTLTSNLLHVEECLQSKVKVYECEREKASMRVLELERALMVQKLEFHERLKTLNTEHEAEIVKVESERRRLSEEYQGYREDREAKVRCLETELSTARGENTSQVKQLLSTIAELESSCRALESDKRSTVHDLEGKLLLINEQLSASGKEKEDLWNESKEKLSALTSQLTIHCQRVKELEAYLGGEIPELEGDRQGITWREEREILCKDVEKYECELRRLDSENRLLNIRLSSLSEILALQESDITKKCGEGMGNIRSLLTQWREKVFMLLVQRKLQEIEDNKKWEESRRKEFSLNQKLEEAERGTQLLSHALADRTAQLQIQETKTKEIEIELEKAVSVINTKEEKLCSQQDACVNIRNSIASMDEFCSGFKFNFNQALTRLANYEQRITFAIKRVQALKATLNCQYALLSCQTVGKADAECQVCEAIESEEAYSLSSLTRGQLEQEMYRLSQERDNLIAQLEDSADTFQQQLKSMKDEYSSEKKKLEERLKETETGGAALKEDLTEMQCKLDSSDAERENQAGRSQELEREVKSLRATLESRIDSELMKEKQRSREELAEMEKLLNIAKREHSKAIVQLQQLTRQLTRDKERAAEAAEIGRARLERELASCRKKLQSVQVERNLLLTTVRQEGLISPLKSRHVIRSHQIGQNYNSVTGGASVTEPPPKGGASVTEPPGASVTGPPPNGGVSVTGPPPNGGVSVTGPPPNGGVSVTGPPPKGGGTHLRTASDSDFDDELIGDQGVYDKDVSIQNGREQEDIRDVLKDLQMMSASLLSMKQQQN